MNTSQVGAIDPIAQGGSVNRHYLAQRGSGLARRRPRRKICVCHFERSRRRSREISRCYGSCNTSAPRSIQVGFSRLIRLIFFARDQLLQLRFSSDSIANVAIMLIVDQFLALILGRESSFNPPLGAPKFAVTSDLLRRCKEPNCSGL